MNEKWEYYVSVIGVGIQKKERTKIETIIKELISDFELKSGLEDLISLLREYKINPTWYHTSHYKFKYQGELLISLKIGNGAGFIENRLTIESERGKPIFDSDSLIPISQQFQTVREFIQTKINIINEKNNKYENSKDSILKSKIAIAMSEALDENNKKNALRLIAFLTENKMSPQHMSPNAWKSSRRGEKSFLFRIRLDNKNAKWSVELNPTLFSKLNPYAPTDFDKYIDENGLREFINNSMKICTNCYHKICARKELDGELGEFNYICNVKWVNPDSETVDKLIKIAKY